MIPLPEIEAAARDVYAAMLPTPQYAWPLCGQRAGREVWVKHENHTPTGAFKVRGGLHLLATLAAAGGRSGHRQRHPRQPRAEPRVRRAPLRHALRDRRAAREFGGQERRDARVRRGADRIRARFRRGAAARGGARARAGPALHRAVRARAGRRRGHLRARAAARGARPGDGLRADRLRLGHLRADQRPRRAGAPTEHRRRRVEPRQRVRAVVRRAAAGRDGDRRTPSPTAWRCGCPFRRRST